VVKGQTLVPKKKTVVVTPQRGKEKVSLISHLKEKGNENAPFESKREKKKLLPFNCCRKSRVGEREAKVQLPVLAVWNFGDGKKKKDRQVKDRRRGHKFDRIKRSRRFRQMDEVVWVENSPKER